MCIGVYFNCIELRNYATNNTPVTKYSDRQSNMELKCTKWLKFLLFPEFQFSWLIKLESFFILVFLVRFFITICLFIGFILDYSYFHKILHIYFFCIFPEISFKIISCLFHIIFQIFVNKLSIAHIRSSDKLFKYQWVHFLLSRIK